MSIVSGWIVVAFVVLAAAIPLGHRLLRGKRAGHASRPIDVHLALGLGVSAVAFLHVIAAIPALGEPAVVEGGMLALAPGVLAFFVLVAHTGIGLQLRKPKLRDRIDKRRVHQITATLIVLAIAAHVVMLRQA